MRKFTVVTAILIVVFAGIGLVRAGGAKQTSQTILSAFELMSQAKDLPVAPHPDAI
jgi:hypothetical protein